MKLEMEFDQSSSTTPKLSLFSLPTKVSQTPPGSLTPPLQSTVASIPFQWEEAPGKPRSITATTGGGATMPPPCNYKSKAVRCLELPPRLLTHENSRVTSMPSPTTVLFEGPDDQQELGRSLRHTMSFSYGSGGEDQKVLGIAGRRYPDTAAGRRKSFSLISSWRWPTGSFRRASVFDFSSSTHHHTGPGINDGLGFELGDSSGSGSSKVKITRSVRRGSSFISFSKSNLMASMYGSFKQALPWRSRRRN